MRPDAPATIDLTTTRRALRSLTGILGEIALRIETSRCDVHAQKGDALSELYDELGEDDGAVRRHDRGRAGESERRSTRRGVVQRIGTPNGSTATCRDRVAPPSAAKASGQAVETPARPEAQPLA